MWRRTRFDHVTVVKIEDLRMGVATKQRPTIEWSSTIYSCTETLLNSHSIFNQPFVFTMKKMYQTTYSKRKLFFRPNVNFKFGFGLNDSRCLFLAYITIFNSWSTGDEGLGSQPSFAPYNRYFSHLFTLKSKQKY